MVSIRSLSFSRLLSESYNDNHFKQFVLLSILNCLGTAVYFLHWIGFENMNNQSLKSVDENFEQIVHCVVYLIFTLHACKDVSACLPIK